MVPVFNLVAGNECQLQGLQLQSEFHGLKQGWIKKNRITL